MAWAAIAIMPSPDVVVNCGGGGVGTVVEPAVLSSCDCSVPLGDLGVRRFFLFLLFSISFIFCL